MLYTVTGYTPRIAKDVFIAPGAAVIGRVSIGGGSGIWFNSVLRGDVVEIAIGCNSNIQDNCTLHGDEGFPLIIGNNVTVGHNAVLHGCRIADDVTVGMGAVILNGAVVGAGAVVAAGALVTEGTKIAPGMLALGTPARVVRAVKEQERQHFQQLSVTYKHRALVYRRELAVVVEK